ncbi:MAG: ribbon-helix-helix protein, CopG family [Acidothermales bacterium]|nr:ribbon-helix-helix protein, CopG family [Acidothermales bacterium]
MRTTVTLDDDVAAAVEAMRQQSGTGVSDAVNRLIRAGLARKRPSKLCRHQTRDLGLKIDVANIGEVLDLLDSN